MTTFTRLVDAVKFLNAARISISWTVTRVPVALLALILAALTQSCFPLFYVDKSYDLTRKPQFHGGYSLDAVYQTKRNLLYDGHDLDEYLRIPGPEKYTATVVYCDRAKSGADRSTFSRAVTVTDYDHYMKSNSDHSSITMVPKGTRFRFVRMQLTDNPWIGARESLTGEFLDEPFVHRQFRLRDVSTCFPNGHEELRRTEKFRHYDVALFWPDPKYVERVPKRSPQVKGNVKVPPAL